VTEEEYDPQTGIHRVLFGNGTILLVKQTDFQPNEVQMAVHFGHGIMSEPRPGMAMLAQSVVRESGVGELTRTQLEEALAGSAATLTVAAGKESFALQGKGLSGELELLLQLIRTHLLDPAFRPAAFRLSMERFGQQYDQMENSVQGMMQLYGERFLAGGNSHFGMPPRQSFMQLTLPEVEKWLAPVFSRAPLEVSLVGDVDPEAAVQMVGSYLGTLDRKAASREYSLEADFPAGESLHKTVSSAIDKAMVTVAWPTDDFWDISRTRRLNILAAVLADRVRQEIRERLGAVYSPVVYNVPSRAVPGYGVLRAMLTVDPLRSEDIAARVLAVAAELGRRGVSDEELTRALEPTLTSIKDMVKTNRYWLQSVMSLSSRHPEQLEWPLTIQEDFAAITAKELTRLAARYLTDSQAALLVFSPEEEQGE
jgi:zinc protease